MNSFETNKKKFQANPLKNPKNNEDVVINSKEYKKLVKKYGPVKIKSPKSNYLITVGNPEYNKLIQSGYTDKQLLESKTKIKSPVSKRMITVNGKTYQDLVKKGYFRDDINNYLNELPKEILNLITSDLDCKSLISLLKTQKYKIEDIEYLLRQNLSQYRNVSNFNLQQLINVCRMDQVDFVQGYATQLYKNINGGYICCWICSQWCLFRC
jgi:hypothetical protein